MPENLPGKATSTVSVSATPGLTLDGVKHTGTYTANAGIVQINYDGDPGHSLAIQNPGYSDFLLRSDGGPTSGAFELATGHYTIYCTIPGHEQAGEKATLVVS